MYLKRGGIFWYSMTVFLKNMQNPLKVAVLLGGKSSEREVSKVSGSAVINALRTNKKFQIRRFDPAENFDELIVALQQKEIDVVYIALHGTHAEDGEIQGLLQQFGVPYTGSGIHASAIAFDKISTKRILRAENIPVADDICIETQGDEFLCSLHTRQKHDFFQTQHHEEGIRKVQEWLPNISFPLFIKAAREGSTVGIVKVKTESDFQRALEEVFSKYSRILIESGLPGKECTGGVLHGQALPIIEISYNEHDFYNYESKYAVGGSTHIIPARISETAQKRLQEINTRIGILLECSGGYRVDSFVYGEEIGVLEVNTLPGMTGTSLLPDAAKAVGISFEELCERMILSAVNNSGS